MWSNQQHSTTCNDWQLWEHKPHYVSFYTIFVTCIPFLLKPDDTKYTLNVRRSLFIKVAECTHFRNDSITFKVWQAHCKTYCFHALHSYTYRSNQMHFKSNLRILLLNTVFSYMLQPPSDKAKYTRKHTWKH